VSGPRTEYYPAREWFRRFAAKLSQPPQAEAAPAGVSLAEIRQLLLEINRKLDEVLRELRELRRATG